VITFLRIVHLLSATVWVGGSTVLVVVGVPAIRATEGEARVAAMLLLTLRGTPLAGWGRRLKDALDVTVALVGVILCLPLMAIISLLIVLDSRGPVFYRQQRIGKAAVPFYAWKFRTMVVGADQRLARDRRLRERFAATYKLVDDPRVTRMGRWLRRTSLDELPQLINVLRGEMSFVGPRPEVPRYVDMFAETYRELLAVRPGITDPASVAFRDEEALLGRSSNAEELYVHEILPRKLALSRAYVRQRSLGLDVRLIARTVAAILGWHAPSAQMEQMESAAAVLEGQR